MTRDRCRQGLALWGLLCILMLGGRHTALAAEAGTSPYLKGYKDFFSGILPPVPGVYLRDDVVYYDGNINRTIIGGRVDANLNQYFVTNIAAPTVVTPLDILGGTYAFGATIPIVGLNVNAGIDTARGGLSRTDDALNVGDIYITPLILGWHAGDLHWNTALSVIAPTGRYQQGALANTGLNYWTVLPQFSITYFEPKSGWDISAAFAFAVNTQNQATNYRTGDIVHLDWAVGKQITPAWKIGVVGYVMDQVTGDSGAGAVLGPNEASVWALGPAATYGFEIGNTPISILAKWTHEVHASHTFQGDTVTAAVSFAF
jgi:hypothetical protein